MPPRPPGAPPFKRGGRIKHTNEAKHATDEAHRKSHNQKGYAHGGRIKGYPLTAGGNSGKGRLEKAKAYGADTSKMRGHYAGGGEVQEQAGQGKAGGQSSDLSPYQKRARGGKVHDDEAEDKKMIKGMVKGAALKRAAGGRTITREEGVEGAKVPKGGSEVGPIEKKGVQTYQRELMRGTRSGSKPGQFGAGDVLE